MSAGAVKFKFVAGGWRSEIAKVECVSETAKMLIIRIPSSFRKGEFHERKHLKISDSECYFDTWAEAHELLISRAERKFDSARDSLELAQAKLGNIKGMKPPAA